MVQLIIWIMLAILAVNIESRHEIGINPAANITVTSAGYPQVTTQSDEWVIGNFQLGGAVLIKCSIRFKGNNGDCRKGRITFSDGTAHEFCEDITQYSLHSKFNSIMITLNLNENTEAAFSCNASAMAQGRIDDPKMNATFDSNLTKTLKHIPNDINLKKYVANYDIVGNLTSHMKYSYVYKCEGKCSIGIKCKIQVSVGVKYAKPCHGFKLMLRSASSRKWECNTAKYFTFLTTDNQLSATVTSGYQVKGTIDCEVMAIDRIQHSQYKKLPADEDYDSSELGLKAAVGTKQSTCDCGWTNKQPSRIIFGHDTAKHEFPWSISLQYKSSKFHFCGGSIITASHILTAAHCIGAKNPKEILVVMGTHNRSDSTISSGVKEIIKHNYNTVNHEHDIAILVLDKKIQFTEIVGPVCLPRINHTELVNEYVTAMGWGRLHKSEIGIKDARIQKKTTLRVIDIGSCTLDWNYHWDVKAPKVICTWGGNTDICVGDSGGPVVWHDPELQRFTLVGMPALCDNCVLRLPSAHTNVHHYFDWIQQSIAKSTEPSANTCYKID